MAIEQIKDDILLSGFIRRSQVTVPNDIVRICKSFWMNKSVYIIGTNFPCQDFFGDAHKPMVSKLTKWSYDHISIERVVMSQTGIIVGDSSDHLWKIKHDGRFHLCPTKVPFINVFSSISTSFTFWKTAEGDIRMNKTSVKNDNANPWQEDVFQTVPIQGIKTIVSGDGWAVAVDECGDIHSYFDWIKANDWRYQKKPEQLSICLMAANKDECFALTSDGAVWSVDNSQVNAHYPLEFAFRFSSGSSRVIQIECGWMHCLVLDSGGHVWSWGHNTSGQCGHPQRAHIADSYRISYLMQWNMIQIKCGIDHSYAKSADGRHFLFGNNEYNQCSLQEHDKNDSVVIPIEITLNVEILGIHPGFKNTSLVLHTSSGLK